MSERRTGKKRKPKERTSKEHAPNTSQPDLQDVYILIVENITGDQFECEVPAGTQISQLAGDFFEARGWDTHDSRGRAQRAVVELIDAENPDNTRRLNGSSTVAEASLSDGDILRIFPESVAGCFLGRVPVLLADGRSKRIDDILIGDELLSGTPASSLLTTTRVSQLFTGLSSKLP